MTSVFDDMCETLFYLEGGFSDNKHDPGGKTKYGITQKTLDKFNSIYKLKYPKDVALITKEQARVIYANMYYTNYGFGSLDPELSMHVFIAGVNIGPVPAIKILQESLGVKKDGILGPITRNAALDAYYDNRVEIIYKFCRKLDAYYRDLSNFKHFGNGWIKRIYVTLMEAPSLNARD